jgi:hypothetical protein
MLERIICNQYSWLPGIDAEAYLMAKTCTIMMHGVLTKAVDDMEAARQLILKENHLPGETDNLKVKWLSKHSLYRPKSSLMDPLFDPQSG